MAHVVVIGAGLGGLPTAYELRHHLPAEHKVTLISDKPEFTFIPGLIRVGLNLNPLEHIQLELEPLARRHGLDLICGHITHFDPENRYLIVDGQTLEFDYAAIATGASLAFDEAPGLGPHGGYTQSVCTPDHAVEAREAWLEFLKDPGSLVVGAMPGAGCFGPAYEFLLMADWELRRLGLRDRVTLTYITPEPYAGHLGVGGVKYAEELTGDLMRSRGVEIIDNAAITEVEPDTIILSDGRRIPFKYSMILPAFRGAKFIRETPRLGNEKGFIPVGPTYQHPEFPAVYALGVAVHLEQPDKTPVPIGLPKSGEMTEVMGVAVAHNIAIELGAISEPHLTPTLEALCFAEFGDTGILYIAAPVIPDPEVGKRRHSLALKGPWVNWAKAAFEEYFLLKMRFGLGLPWFEKFGLRLLFRLSLFKNLPKNFRQSVEKSTTAVG
ncbi:MAG: NAD(P)/FAD-dependent oxidoreductase [Limnospira sp.]